MARHGAKWWAERLEELAQGGDAAEIARRHGVKERTLLWWRSELQRRGRKTSKPRLLPVVVAAPDVVTAATTGELLVEIGPMRMTMRGVTAEQLAAIVSAAARAC